MSDESLDTYFKRMAAQQKIAQRSTEAYLKLMAEKRIPALAAAEKLLRAGDYDGAEKTMRQAEDSIYAALDLAKVYKQVTTEAVQNRSLPHDRLRELARRATYWTMNCYPEPHTECEGEAQSRHHNETEAEYTALVGFNPIR